MEMVERLARAIAEKQDGSAELWRIYEVSVRDGIEVMREPTNFMIDEGCKARDPRNSINDNTIATYVAMIDAALKTV